jgi:hypothetical protein
LIERSIQLNPSNDGRKYLNYAEMLQGLDAIQMYKKGIEVFNKDINNYKQGGHHDDAKLASKQ